jgi:sugar lactone lactonase YvrE
MNRGWQNDALGGLLMTEALAGMAAPPVVIYDPAGNVTASWGDASYVEPKGAAKAMPEGFHGCYVDQEDNIWMVGNADSVAQKYSPDGKLLLQIGEKGKCDGDVDDNSRNYFKSCGENKARNSSRTSLNSPADVWIDTDPDPATKERGNVYIADGYGNHRIVVFNAKGQFVRQFGSAGDGEGQFGKTGGGHPHCVAISHDALVYACDRPHNRILVFERTGKYIKSLAVNPVDGSVALLRTNDLVFSNDPQQTYIYTTDAGNAVVQILNRRTGAIVGTIGVGPGRQAGSLLAPHQLAVDSEGNVYIAETIGRRRVQRFLRQ